LKKNIFQILCDKEAPGPSTGDLEILQQLKETFIGISNTENELVKMLMLLLKSWSNKEVKSEFPACLHDLER
jgi:hypothetical protein